MRDNKIGELRPPALSSVFSCKYGRCIIKGDTKNKGDTKRGVTTSNIRHLSIFYLENFIFSGLYDKTMVFISN